MALKLPTLEEERNPDIQQHKVTIRNSHSENLVGILHETGSKELVILCHGFRSSKERIPMVNLAAALAKEGISAFRFDFAGNGESEGSFQYGNYHKESDDLRAVVQHFFEEKRQVFAIVGHSKGGNVVLLYASKYNDVHTVINISGRFDLGKGIESRLGKDFLGRIKANGFIDVKNRKGKFQYRVTEESLMDRLTTDTRSASLLISRNCRSDTTDHFATYSYNFPAVVRVLTIHGSMDNIVPVNDAFEFVNLIPNHKLHIIQGADHEYTLHQVELAAVVLDFIKAAPHQTEDADEQDDQHETTKSEVWMQPARGQEVVAVPNLMAY
ncbi:Serine aminopeptidase, S33 [Dillenia turbinata]|uniref:Serine aminopeptidase, S33 n=1 Tax=Dillenia turbinata TaxID=194707 RepID=A0AAN8Z725_9MAGN